MELPTINDLDNGDWRLTLYSTIEFLKGEINVKNELINKLSNRCNDCEQNTKSLNDGFNNSDYDDQSYSSEKANSDHVKLQNTIDILHRVRKAG